MNVATITVAMLAALGLLAAGPAMAQSSADQPASGTAGGMTQGGQAATDVSDEELREYARVWRQIQDDAQNQELATALQSGADLEGMEQDLSTALNTTGSAMTVEEFEQVHRQVQADPSLRARMEQETGLGTSGGAGSTSGAQEPSLSGSGSEPVRPGQGAPLPDEGLGYGPATLAPATPPSASQPGVGEGAPVTSGQEGGDGGTSGTSGAPGGTSGGATGGGAGGSSDTTQ